MIDSSVKTFKGIDVQNSLTICTGLRSNDLNGLNDIHDLNGVK